MDRRSAKRACPTSCVIVALVALAACGDGTIPPPVNEPPVAVGSIRDRAMNKRDTASLDVSGFFSDPEGDPLTYTARSSDTDVVGTAITGSRLTLTTKTVSGEATVTVQAEDPDGGTATQAFRTAVENRSPEPVGSIADRTANKWDTVSFDVLEFFRDPDGDPLSYSAESGDAGVVEVVVNGSGLTLSSAGVSGEATVAVHADDTEGARATQKFLVQIRNRPPVVTEPIRDQILVPDRRRTIDLSGHFEDPDGDELAYTATSSSPFVEVDIAGAELTLEGLSAGTASIGVTASDSEATVDVAFDARVGSSRWREDFTDSTAVNDWERVGPGEVAVKDGKLQVTIPGDLNDRTYLWKDSTILIDEDWEVSASVGEGGTDVWCTLVITTGDEDVPMWTFDFIPLDNDHWGFGAFVKSGREWEELILGVRKKPVGDGFATISVKLASDTLTLTVAGEDLYQGEIGDWWDTSYGDTPPKGATGAGAGAFFSSTSGTTAKFDWIEVEAIR